MRNFRPTEVRQSYGSMCMG